MQLKIVASKIWIASDAIDFRKSIDGLCAIAHDLPDAKIREDVFVFYSRDRKKVKILSWHKNGFVLLYKRLEQSRFIFYENKKGVAVITQQQLSWLLAGLNWIQLSTWDELEFDAFY